MTWTEATLLTLAMIAAASVYTLYAVWVTEKTAHKAFVFPFLAVMTPIAVAITIALRFSA